MSEKDMARIDTSVKQVIQSLPSSFGHRFLFDSALIKSMAEDWGGEELLSSFVVPRYHNEWGHASIALPAHFVKDHDEPQDLRARIVDLVLLPGEDQIADVDLLGYAWIAHELGHHLLFREGHHFMREVGKTISSVQSRLRLAAIADRGRVRASALSLVERIVEFWSPSPDHRNWSHELAADLVGLWVLGDTYLDTFTEFLESIQPNPFVVGPVHPPYAVRANALVRCADLRTVQDSTERLSRAMAHLEEKYCEHRSNEFQFFAVEALITAVTRAAFQQFESLGLRSCLPSSSADDHPLPLQPTEQQFGTELLLSARLVHRKWPDRFDDWQEQVVDTLVSSVTL